MKYRAQFSKAKLNQDGTLSPIRGLHRETKFVDVEANDLTEANQKAEEKLGEDKYNWLMDGHVQRLGAHIGPMIG